MSDFEIKRDISKLGESMGTGFAATTILVDQMDRKIGEIQKRLDDKADRDQASHLQLSNEVSRLTATIEGLKPLQTLAERVAKLEAGHEHVRADVTGKHDAAKQALASSDKKEDRELEKKKLKSAERSGKLRLIGSVLVASLPGIIAILWHLLSIPGEPPRPSSSHRDHGSESSETRVP